MTNDPPPEFQSTLVARISQDDIVIYANAAMAGYLRTRKEVLIGASLETLALRVKGEIQSCFQRFDTPRPAHLLVTDEGGRVFEARTYRDGGVLDILLDEVTTAKAVHRSLNSQSGIPVESLTGDELRTARQPESRFLTVMLSRVDNAPELVERLPASEARITMNLFAEESADAVVSSGGSVFPMSVDEVLGIYGAPRHFADHALRALRSACAQSERFSDLRASFHREGKELPPIQCGIWSGEAFVGTFGSSSAARYSAMGRVVEMAGRLARLAKPGEVLLTEPSLSSLLENLPSGWQAIKAASESPPDLSDFKWKGEDVVPLPEQYRQVVWLIGPGVEADASAAEFYLEYIWALGATAGGATVPVLRVLRPTASGDLSPLKDDNVVQKSFDQVLGKYRLVSEIGSGGMGKVWKGIDRLGNTVAIKVLHGHETTSETLLKRFRREADIMARLHHRNICRIFEMSEFEGLQFIVMEFVDGVTLEHLIHGLFRITLDGQTPSDLRSLIQAIRNGDAPGGARERPKSKAESSKRRILPVEQTLSVMLKVCDAVQFAHEHGILHRDLKPGNILLREDGEPLVADFGLAKVHGEDAGQSLSVSGHVVGTLQNMAPEQAESSKDVDERADVYSLGTILYLMLTGERQFKTTGNLVVDIQALRALEPVPLRRLNPSLDQDLEIVVLKALRTNPDERYRSVSALAADLTRYRLGEPISARPVTVMDIVAKTIRRNRAMTVLAATFLFILLAGGALSVWKISERAIVAENALKGGEKSRLAVQQAEALAITRQTEAEKALRDAEKARDEAGKARKEFETATKDTVRIRDENKALAEKLSSASAEVRNLKDEAGTREKRIAELEKSALAGGTAQDELKGRIAELESKATVQSAPKPLSDKETASAEVFSDMAATHLRQKLEEKELWKQIRTPLVVLERISDGIALASKALTEDSTYAPAWMLKGRYHIACMEIDAAEHAFRMAAESPARRTAEGLPPLTNPEDPAPMLEIVTQLRKPSGDGMGNAAALLRKTTAADNRTIAAVLAWMRGKPGINNALVPNRSTNTRPVSRGENLLNFISVNGGYGKIKVVGETPDGAVQALEISGVKKIQITEPLKLIKSAPLKLTIRGAEDINWAQLSRLTVRSLDLEGCRIPAPPANIPAFADLQELALRNTPVDNLAFLRATPMLVSLDIAGTKASDLEPLHNCRALRNLDASGLAVSNFGKMFPASVGNLVVSPALLTPEALQALRNLRSISSLRLPDERSGQNAKAFWEHWDASKKPGT